MSKYPASAEVNTHDSFVIYLGIKTSQMHLNRNGVVVWEVRKMRNL